jgi:hypothetical protein
MHWSVLVALSAFLLVSPLARAAAAAEAAREYGGYYTRQRIANLRANCQKYDWAKKQRDATVAAAKPWVEKSDDQLWAMVPGQDLPRTIDVTIDRNAKGPLRLGCLVCGKKIDRFGNYPYKPDFDHKPWKLTCPSCGAVFPTNDFGKYFASAIDEHGLFHPTKGDRSLLFNVEHPDPKDPLHTYGVDDGFGYVDPKTGRAHKFIGYYTWKLWDHIQDGLGALADAYLYTGDARYAHKAAVLLDRIADVYPSMDWKPYADRGWYHSDGGRGVGKIQGSIWETGTVRALAGAYDKILSGTRDDAALYAFLKRQSERYKLPSRKGTRELFVRNVDDNLLRTAFAAILSQQIRGNEGMHQAAAVACAQALDTDPDTTRWLDWVFAPDGGAVPALIVNQFDRDGLSPEGAPGYAVLWGRSISDLATRLTDYPRYTKHNVFRDYPQFRATYRAAWRLMALGKAVPNIGDTGSTGAVGGVGGSAEFAATGYRYTKDPAIAAAAYRLNGNSADGLGRDIFWSDPEALPRQIERMGKSAGPRPAGSLLTGFGLAILESPAAPGGGVALACNYGRTTHHAHLDHLNFDLFAFGHWLAPDLGYPEYATPTPERNAWVVNTVSHNTVVVDQTPQRPDWGGKLRLYKQLPGFGAFRIDGRSGYPQLQAYERTMVLIDVPAESADGAVGGAGGGAGGAYIVDLFRVAGGKDHLFSFHGPPGEVTATGLNLVAQKRGSYAGEDVEPEAQSNGAPLGYSWLYNVRRDAKPAPQFVLDWKAQAGYRGLKASDDVHLRLHALTACGDVALADGDPPQNKPGNPRRLTYALLHRSGSENLDSTFVSVIEPYQKRPLIKSIARINTGGDGGVALRIELADGSVDRLLIGTPQKPMRLEDGLTFAGTVGFVRESGGKATKAVLVEGSELTYKDASLNASPALTGKVVKMKKDMAGEGWIAVDAALPADGSLTGQPIMIANDNERDACYVISKVEPTPAGS